MTSTGRDSGAAELQRLLTELAALQHRLGQYQEGEALEEVRRSLRDDAPFTLLVVGEFNTGKSTLINALLGESILPMGIVPTTATINVIRHAPERSIEIIYRNGKTLACEWSAEALQKLTARHGSHEEVGYVTVASPQVPPNLQIIDTPGVNDVCETRAEIVYDWIPKADLVLFLLNAQQALKESERAFLRKRVLGQTLTRAVFVLNHSDRLSRSELQQVHKQVTEDLRAILKDAAATLRSSDAERLAGEIAAVSETLEVCPLSARAALRGQTTHEEDLGGLPHLQAVIRPYLEGSQRERLLARKALSLALLECHRIDSYTDTVVALRQSSEQHRGAFLQGLAPRLEGALIALERLHSEVEALRADLCSHSTAHFVRTRQVLLQQIRAGHPSAEELSTQIEAAFRGAIEAELEYTNARLSAASTSLAGHAMASDFAVPTSSLRGLSDSHGGGEDPLGAIFGKPGQREWLLLLAPVVIWQLGIVGVLAGLAAPVVLNWLRQGAAEQELLVRVEAALREIEEQLVERFALAASPRLNQLIAPLLNQVDLLQAALLAALGREAEIDLTQLVRDRDYANGLQVQLRMLASSYAD